jgi:hypothetical protein
MHEFVYSKTRPAAADSKQKSNLQRNKKATERLPLNEAMVTFLCRRSDSVRSDWCYI